LVLIFFIVLLATRDRDVTGFDSSRLEGEVAPAIVGVTIDGATFDLDDHRGGFVVVNFFQTTCLPCIQEHPELVAFQTTHAPSGFASVVSVAFDDRLDNIRSFFDEFGGDWPILGSDTAPLAVDYGVALVPESIVVAPNGEVVKKLLGGVSQAQLEAVMQSWQEANA
jgi:cytochrome c biogenesis protein CcmG/thiol:disulfide interchange protein DsbE